MGFLRLTGEADSNMGNSVMAKLATPSKNPVNFSDGEWKYRLVVQVANSHINNSV